MCVLISDPGVLSLAAKGNPFSLWTADESPQLVILVYFLIVRWSAERIFCPPLHGKPSTATTRCRSWTSALLCAYKREAVAAWFGLGPQLELESCHLIVWYGCALSRSILWSLVERKAKASRALEHARAKRLSHRGEGRRAVVVSGIETRRDEVGMRSENHARFARMYARRRNVGVGNGTSDPRWNPRYFLCDSVARDVKFDVMYLQYATSNEMTINHSQLAALMKKLRGFIVYKECCYHCMKA